MATLRIKKVGDGYRFYGRWRDGSKDVERPVGAAWVVPVGHADAKPNGGVCGSYVDRKGRNAPAGFLSVDAAKGELPKVKQAWTDEQAALVADLTPEQIRAQKLRAQAEAIIAQADALEGDQLVTFGKAAEAWYAHRRDVKDCKPSTLRDYRNALDSTILPVLGDRALWGLGPADILAFREGLRTKTKTNAKGETTVTTRTPRTINKYLVLVDGILRLASRSVGAGGFELEKNPAKEVEKLKSRPAKFKPITAYEVVVVANALAAGKHRGVDIERTAAERYEDARDSAAVITAGFAGLRLGELLGLQWQDVSLGNAKLTVERAIVRGVPGTTKGDKSRVVPMADVVAKALARLDLAAREFAKETKIPTALTGEAFVFAGVAGGSIDGTNLTKRYRAACLATGVRIVKFHGLRHTFVTTAREGMSVDRVQAMAGHEDAATAQGYANPEGRSTDAALLSETIAAVIAQNEKERGTTA